VNSRTQSVIVYILLFAAIIALVVYGMNRPQTEDEVLTINQLASEIMSGNVSKITVEEDKLTVLDKSGLVERTATKETNSTLVEQLLALGVTPDQLSPDNGISIEIKAPSKL
jgi:preprotein translocase subunit YajC